MKVYTDPGSCFQSAAILHHHVSKEACCGRSSCLTACFIRTMHSSNKPAKTKVNEVSGLGCTGHCSSLTCSGEGR